MDTVVLASSSPRRSELLGRICGNFRCVSPEINETLDANESASEAVVRLAYQKALTACDFRVHAPVIAADTLTYMEDGTVLGKPLEPDRALHMLHLVSGKRLNVVTGVAIRNAEGSWFRSMVHGFVVFRQLSTRVIRDYVATGEPLDKAGGFALQGQGSTLLDKVDGCITSIVGLPLCVVGNILFPKTCDSKSENSCDCFDLLMSPIN